jgi:uncharacterized protein Yka (UPF0111/DUF47 family)
MPDSEDYRIPITADVSDLLSGFDQAASSAEEAGERIKGGMEEGAEGMEHMHEASEEAGSSMSELKEKIDEHAESLGKLSEGWSAVLGLVVGGGIAEAFKKIAETLAENSQEMQMFAARTQMSLGEAKDFSASMEAMGVPVQGATMAMRRLSQEIATGGEKLDKLMGQGYTASAATKSLGEVYDEVAAKLSTYGNNAKEAADANTLLGRSGQVLVATHQAQKEIGEQLASVYEALGGDAQKLAEQGNQVRYMQTLMNDAWVAFAQSLTPAVVTGIKIIIGAMMEMMAIIEELINDVKMLIQALETLASVAGSVLGAVVKDVQAVGQAISDAAHFNVTGAFKDLQTDNLSKALDDAGSKVKELGDAFNENDKQNEERQTKTAKVIEHLWDGTWERIAKKQADAMGAATSGAGAPDLAKGHGGGKGKADPMANLDEALDLSKKKMETLNDEFKRMGSESQMAAKEGGLSYDELRQRATQDYEYMQEKYKEFTDAVKSGSKQAATESEKDWRAAAQQFQKDWDQAARKAQQDMQEVKSTASQLSSEVSSILNTAMSGGKVNWAQELSKILQKMLDELIKYIFQMVAMWAQGQTLMAASQQAAHGNMIGELITWLASMFTAKKAAASAQATTDAGTAAAGTMASLSSIPYVGPAIAAATAPVIYSETLSYGMAESGYDVPPGISPLTQLHPREMVLPAHLAGAVRDMAGGGGVGQGGNISVTNNIKAWDSKGVADMLVGNKSLIASIVASARRSGMQFNLG